jgi:ABC-type Fe3+ transport system permease subunit
LLLSGAVWLFLWAPLLLLGARATVLALQHPVLWREIVLARGVWLGTLQLCLCSALGATILGVPLGFCIARGPKWLRFWGAVGCALPLGVPPLILAAPFVSASGKPDFRSFFRV